MRREFKAVLTLGVSGGDWRKGQGAPEVLLAYQGAGYMGKCGNSLSCVCVGFPGYMSLSQKFQK